MRDLVTGLEGQVLIALAVTLATAAVEMAAGPWRRPAPHPAVPPPSRRPTPARRPEVVHGLLAFADALPGETLAEYQARHRPAAAARYRAAAGSQARWLRRALAGDEGATARLTPALRATLVGLDPAARDDLATLPRERLARLIPAIVAGEYAPPPVEPPPDAAPDVAPEEAAP
ncbi:hypothetical protein [Azospirillum sp. TSO22-1]|uniref:hypothetical protein n=1 Tax=Azospirillum sp. TSO22-1 TaxID=716789 RepID=UPI0011B5F213|nr:hypothetical protein [Azospirillum sp. TSO22-1]